MSQTTPKQRPRKTARAKETDSEPGPPTAPDAGHDANSIPESAPVTANPSPTHGLDTDIRRRAYELFLARGAMSGDDVADWFEAERQVRSERDATAEQVPTSLMV